MSKIYYIHIACVPNKITIYSCSFLSMYCKNVDYRHLDLIPDFKNSRGYFWAYSIALKCENRPKTLFFKHFRAMLNGIKEDFFLN